MPQPKSAANVIKFPRKWEGDRNGAHFVARPKISFDKVKRRCITCNRRVRRSHRTGILHSRCFNCRYLVMIYGPSIRVEYPED